MLSDDLRQRIQPCVIVLSRLPHSPDSGGEGSTRRSTFRSRVWLPAVADSVGQPMRFHDLRHSHVALLIAEGAHPAVIASRLGHTSVKTVLDVYGTSTKASTATPQTPSNLPESLLMWTHRGRDATDTATKEGADLGNLSHHKASRPVRVDGLESPTSAL